MGVNNWPNQPLKELCTRIGDGLHGTPKYSESSDIPFINGNNLKNGQILVTNNTNYVTDEEFERNFIKLDHNSLLLSINGTLGSMAFYNDEVIMLGKSAAYLNFKTDINRFYYYYFQLPGVQTYFYNVATGSTIKNLSLKSIQDFEVPVPKKNEYEKIAKALSDLDAKIELNNKINTELEAMAKLIYDYWFVQFDFPNENGKPYKSSGGKMVYNEALKREIPEGWEVKDLEDIESNIVTGKTPSTKKDEFYNGEIPFITIGDIRGNMHITQTEQTLSILGGNQNPNKFLPKGSICVTCIASPGLVGFVTKDSQTNQQINSIICKNEEIKLFLYFYLKDYFKFAKASSGSTFSNMNKGEFSSIKTIKPRKEILIDFSNKLLSACKNVLKSCGTLYKHFIL